MIKEFKVGSVPFRASAEDGKITLVLDNGYSIIVSVADKKVDHIELFHEETGIAFINSEIFFYNDNFWEKLREGEIEFASGAELRG